MARYEIEGIEYPSVTQITGLLDKSDALLGWATGCMEKYILNKLGEGSIEDIIHEARFNYKEISNEAKDIGTEVHNMIEWHIKSIIEKSEMPSYKGDRADEVQNGYLAFLDWEKENIKQWHESELTVVNNEFYYAGQLDAVAELADGRMFVIDFKTSKGFYDGYDLQIAAYRNTDKIKNEYKIDGMGVLRLDKETGQPEWKEYKNYGRALAAFLALLDYYYSAKKRRLKNNPAVEKYHKKLN